MITGETVLNIINETGIESLKTILPKEAYELIKKKYNKENQLPYLKQVIKKFERKNKDQQKLVEKLTKKQHLIDAN